MNEFSLIQQFFQQAANQQDHPSPIMIKGIGDDAAVLQPPLGQQLVISTDTLVSGRHFPVGTPAHAIGWKSAAVNLSDLAAMGATPQALLLAISLPHADESWLAEFSQGFFDCCAVDHVQLIGGDTTKSQLLTITVTALGWVPNGQAVYRHGAQVGDLIVVSNTLGDAAYALKNPDSPLQHRLDYPKPQNKLGMALRNVAHSMLDISDGLAQDLGHILSASQVGAVLHLDQLPFSSLLKQCDDRTKFEYALSGGDDYELCFTLSPQQFDQFCGQYAGQFDVHVVGEIRAQLGLQLMHDQRPVEFNLKGYQHFD
jgi:thiamine-monophosphate kinase